jgi:hypothetical protein
MAKQTSVFATRTVKNSAVTFVNADGTTAKDLFTAGADDSLLRSVGIVSDDTASRVIDLFLHNGTTAFLLGSVNIPAASGSDGTTPEINALLFASLPLDARDKKFIPLKTGWKLQAKMQGAVTAAKTVTVICLGEDY